MDYYNFPRRHNSTNQDYPNKMIYLLLRGKYKNTSYTHTYVHLCAYIVFSMGFPGGSEVKYWPAMQEAPCNARDVGSVSGLGRSRGDGNGNPHLGIPMDRGGWQATVHGVTRVGHSD